MTKRSVFYALCVVAVLLAGYLTAPADRRLPRRNFEPEHYEKPNLQMAQRRSAMAETRMKAASGIKSREGNFNQNKCLQTPQT